MCQLNVLGLTFTYQNASLESHPPSFDQFISKTCYIHIDRGRELPRCTNFVTQMAECHFIVEPTGADSWDQNKEAEKYNDTFGVTT